MITEAQLQKIDQECKAAEAFMLRDNYYRVHGKVEPYFYIDCKDWWQVRALLARGEFAEWRFEE